MQGFLFFTYIICFNLSQKQQSQKVRYGIYVNDTTSNKVYSSQLKLNCDYTFEYSFKGNCFSDYYYGSWKKSNDTLRLIIDSSISMTNIYKHEIIFKSDPDFIKLYELDWSGEMKKSLNRFLLNHCKKERVKFKKAYSMKAREKNWSLGLVELFHCAI